MSANRTDGCYIAGDWGTSRLRLYLTDRQSAAVLERLQGEGIGNVARGTHEQLLTRLLADWHSCYPIQQHIFCGMVGSTIGWVEAGYVSCPVSPMRLAGQLCRPPTSLEQCRIIPGLICNNALGQADVMRGEETQIVGAFHLMPELLRGRHLLCLPGTHCKWVWLQDGEVIRFNTSLSGEVFALLRQHSVLVPDRADTLLAAIDEDGFLRGLQQIIRYPDIDLLHLLFATRSQQLAGELDPDCAGAFLSGLIVGRDLAGAGNLYGNLEFDSMVIIGQAAIASLYRTAAAQLPWSNRAPVAVIDGDRASCLGMHVIAWGEGAAL